MKKTSRITLLCLILLLYIGCAPKLTVMVDGYPMNNNQCYEKNPETELVANYYLSRYYFKKVDKDEEPYLYPESLDLDAKRLALGDNTKTVCLHVRVTNPKKVYYKAIEKFEILYKGEKYPYYVERLLYSGKTYTKAFQVRGQAFPGSKVRIRFLIYLSDKKGKILCKLPIMEIGNVNYRILERRIIE